MPDFPVFADHSFSVPEGIVVRRGLIAGRPVLVFEDPNAMASGQVRGRVGVVEATFNPKTSLEGILGAIHSPLK